MSSAIAHKIWDPICMAVGVHVVLTNTTPGRPGNGRGDVYVIPAGDVTSTLEIL